MLKVERIIKIFVEKLELGKNFLYIFFFIFQTKPIKFNLNKRKHHTVTKRLSVPNKKFTKLKKNFLSLYFFFFSGLKIK